MVTIIIRIKIIMIIYIYVCVNIQNNITTIKIIMQTKKRNNKSNKNDHHIVSSTPRSPRQQTSGPRPRSPISSSKKIRWLLNDFGANYRYDVMTVMTHFHLI